MSDAFEIFLGNPHAIGTEEGGCVHLQDGRWSDHVQAHFDGTGPPVGVYPVWEGLVGWGCVDWDNGAADVEHAFNVKNVIAKVTGHPNSLWVEASRSKGFHLWWFINTWVEMDLMRKALLAACNLVDAPTREVNPKQFELGEGQVGNYVRLPYPGGYTGLTREDGFRSRTFYEVRDGGFSHITWPEFLAEVDEAPAQAVVTMASYYVPPQVVVGKYKPLAGAPEAKLAGLSHKLFFEGPLDASDRSSQIYRFARLLVEGQRHTPEEVHELVLEFDERWFDPPKYKGRPDQERRVNELVTRVFGEGVEHG